MSDIQSKISASGMRFERAINGPKKPVNRHLATVLRNRLTISDTLTRKRVNAPNGVRLFSGQDDFTAFRLKRIALGCIRGMLARQYSLKGEIEQQEGRR
jgi:hypothetical protein